MTESQHILRRIYQTHKELLPTYMPRANEDCKGLSKTECSMRDSCAWLNAATCASALPTAMQSMPAPPYYNLRVNSFLQQYDPTRDETGAYGFYREGRDRKLEVGLDLFVQHNINTVNPKERVFPIHYPWATTNKAENLIGPTAIVKGCSLHFPEN
jgi:hypothetical protein